MSVTISEPELGRIRNHISKWAVSCSCGGREFQAERLVHRQSDEVEIPTVGLVCTQCLRLLEFAWKPMMESAGADR